MTHAPHSIALKFTQCKQCDHETFNKVQAMNQNQSSIWTRKLQLFSTTTFGKMLRTLSSKSTRNKALVQKMPHDE